MARKWVETKRNAGEVRTHILKTSGIVEDLSNS